MSDEQTTRILERAADMVAHGWLQHRAAVTADGRFVPCSWNYWDERPVAVCFTEAVYRAIYLETGAKSASSPAAVACRDRILAIKPELRNTGGPSWNNAPERTQAEVVALLRAAASSTVGRADSVDPGQAPQGAADPPV